MNTNLGFSVLCHSHHQQDCGFHAAPVEITVVTVDVRVTKAASSPTYVTKIHSLDGKSKLHVPQIAAQRTVSTRNDITASRTSLW